MAFGECWECTSLLKAEVGLPFNGLLGWEEQVLLLPLTIGVSYIEYYIFFPFLMYLENNVIMTAF